MIAVEPGRPLKKVKSLSPGVCRLGEALTELLKLYPEPIGATEEFPLIALEEEDGLLLCQPCYEG